MNLSVDDIILLQVRGRLHGQRIINDWWYRISELTTVFETTVDQMTVLTVFQAAFEAGLLTHMSDEYMVDEYRLSCFHVIPDSAPTRFAFKSIFPAETGGGVVESSLPTTVCATIKRQAEFAGNNQRGRIFLTGIPVSYELDSELTDAAHDTYTTDSAIMTMKPSSLGNWTLQPILKPEGDFTITRDVKTTSVGKVLRVQRRREVGRGE